jgi:hypothetical protein
MTQTAIIYLQINNKLEIKVLNNIESIARAREKLMHHAQIIALFVKRTQKKKQYAVKRDNHTAVSSIISSDKHLVNSK